MPAAIDTEPRPSRKSRKRAGESGPRAGLPFVVQMNTSCSALRYGSGRSRTLLITLKMAELAPTPSVSVTIAMTANPGVFLSDRRANETSWTKSFHIRALDGRNVLRLVRGARFCRKGKGEAVMGERPRLTR